MPLTDATFADCVASGANADAASGANFASATISARTAHAHDEEDALASIADAAAQSALPATGFDAAINSADRWAKTTDECAGRARSTAAQSSGTAQEYERWYNTMMEVVGGCVLMKSEHEENHRRTEAEIVWNYERNLKTEHTGLNCETHRQECWKSGSCRWRDRRKRA